MRRGGSGTSNAGAAEKFATSHVDAGFSLGHRFLHGFVLRDVPASSLVFYLRMIPG